MPFEFLLFGLMLLGVALYYRHALPIAAGGLAVIVLYEWVFTRFPAGAGWSGLAAHCSHEWVLLANLLLLLVGFTLVARHFEESGIPATLPRYLPDDWTGAFALLVLTFVASSFLDNIAAALIGGAAAHTLFRGRVTVGYIAAIVAAANAGGAGSVIGDTTTTMMWISGVAPVQVAHAYIAAVTALLIFGIAAARRQQRIAPIIKEAQATVRIDWMRIVISSWVLACAVAVNVTVNLAWPGMAGRFPFIGATVALSLLLTIGLRRPDWAALPRAFRGAVFLLCLVASASLMPVESLPTASWHSALTLGFASAVFDNIPLTAIALKQGGYDWGVLAFAVGFGGSMMWFGSSAGVAICGLYPEARSTGRWLREGWLIPVAYVAGFTLLLVMLGWRPDQG
jgi:Na+/H+ antiporter NhaD/arsenite permease-like protein